MKLNTYSLLVLAQTIGKNDNRNRLSWKTNDLKKTPPYFNLKTSYLKELNTETVENDKLELSTEYKDMFNGRFFNKKNNRNRFLTKLGNKYIPLKIDDIAYFYKDEIVFARNFKGDNYPLSDSLTNIEKQISPDSFFRASRQILVNLEAIDYLAQYKPGQLLLKVLPKFEETILLSQERSSAIKKLLS